jgi:hypothetical protein
VLAKKKKKREREKFHQKPLRNHKHFLAGYKINIQKSVAFLYCKNKQTKKEIRETIPFTTTLKKTK